MYRAVLLITILGLISTASETQLLSTWEKSDLLLFPVHWQCAWNCAQHGYLATHGWGPDWVGDQLSPCAAAEVEFSWGT